MLGLVKHIDQFTALSGRLVRWLSLLMVIFTCLVVILRYLFEIPSIALQEAVMYLHAGLFMLGAAYTWQQGGHVRVDIFYRQMTIRQKSLVNAAGILLFVIPFCIFLLFVSWQYVFTAWQIKEGSPEASGLPLVFILKSLIIVLPLMLIIQSIAELLRILIQLVTKDSAVELNND